MQVSKKVRLLEEQDIIQDTLLHLKHAYLLRENIVHLLANEACSNSQHRVIEKSLGNNRGRVVYHRNLWKSCSTV